MNEETKKCSKCGEVKPVNKFYKDRRQCKECIKESRRQYCLNNSEKVKEYQRQWYLNHPGYQRQWNLNNPEKAKENKRRWHLNNSEKEKKSCRQSYLNHYKKVKERSRQWSLNNQEKVRESSRRWKLNNQEMVKDNNCRYRLKLANGYIKDLLRRQGISNIELWLIEVKRQQIALNRYFKNNNMGG